MNKQKLITTLLTSLLIATLTGCQGDSNPETSSTINRSLSFNFNSLTLLAHDKSGGLQTITINYHGEPLTQALNVEFSSNDSQNIKFTTGGEHGQCQIQVGADSCSTTILASSIQGNYIITATAPSIETVQLPISVYNMPDLKFANTNLTTDAEPARLTTLLQLVGEPQGYPEIIVKLASSSPFIQLDHDTCHLSGTQTNCDLTIHSAGHSGSYQIQIADIYAAADHSQIHDYLVPQPVSITVADMDKPAHISWQSANPTLYYGKTTNVTLKLDNPEEVTSPRQVNLTSDDAQLEIKPNSCQLSTHNPSCKISLKSDKPGKAILNAEVVSGEMIMPLVLTTVNYLEFTNCADESGSCSIAVGTAKTKETATATSTLQFHGTIAANEQLIIPINTSKLYSAHGSVDGVEVNNNQAQCVISAAKTACTINANVEAQKAPPPMNYWKNGSISFTASSPQANLVVSNYLKVSHN